MEGIPADTLEDCCQLVKANSIQGNKVDNLSIVYTPVSNLKKTASMEVGQVKTPITTILCLRADGKQALACLIH